MCWSNLRLNNHTWNPLDNVCIGDKRYEGTTEDYKGEGEQCPAYGYCLDYPRDQLQNPDEEAETVWNRRMGWQRGQRYEFGGARLDTVGRLE